jgi:hypothetical protein
VWKQRFAFAIKAWQPHVTRSTEPKRYGGQASRLHAQASCLCPMICGFPEVPLNDKDNHGENGIGIEWIMLLTITRLTMAMAT